MVQECQLDLQMVGRSRHLLEAVAGFAVAADCNTIEDLGMEVRAVEGSLVEELLVMAVSAELAVLVAGILEAHEEDNLEVEPDHKRSDIHVTVWEADRSHSQQVAATWMIRVVLRNLSLP